MHQARLWFARIIMAYALLIFAFLAYLYILEPMEHIAGFGIRASGVPGVHQFLTRGTRRVVSGNGTVRCLRAGPAGAAAQLPVGAGDLQRLRGRRAALRHRSGWRFAHATVGTAQRGTVLAAIRGRAGGLPAPAIKVKGR